MATALTPQQTRFVQHLRALTGLNSRVLSSWVLAEMGGRNSAAAQKRVAAKNNNWLNIGYFDSGAGKLTGDSVWSSPERAARATAQFLKGEKYGASSGIRKILSTAGGSQQDQIRAIAGSGWASSSYDHGKTLQTLLGQAPAPGSAGAGADGEVKSTEGSLAAQQSVPTADQYRDAGEAQAAIVAALGLAQGKRGVGGGISALQTPDSLKGAASLIPQVMQSGAGGGPTQQQGVSSALAAIAQLKELPGAPGSPVKTADQIADPKAPSGQLAQFVERANQIDASKQPYLWGGGHGGKVTVGKGRVQALDCSGAVSAVLGIDPRVSGQFEKWGRAGDGGNKGVTVYANGEHVLMKINGHFFGTSKSNPGGGAGWIKQGAISKQYLARFTARHTARV